MLLYFYFYFFRCVVSTCVLRSGSGHVCVYLLKLLYANPCIVVIWLDFIFIYFLIILSIVGVYTFFCFFLYSALCLKFG